MSLTPDRLTVAFGAALVRDQHVSPAAIEAAMRYAAEMNVALQDAVVGLGVVNEQVAYTALAAAAGVPFADLRLLDPSPLARRLVPEAVSRRHEVLPVAVDDRHIRYVTAEPCDAVANRHVSMVAGRPALAMVTCRSELRVALQLSARLDGKAPAPPAGSAVHAAARRTVLIVDDEATTRTLVRLLLERDGFQVLEAFNGRQALALAATRDLDLIVMDLLMPELDGYGAIRELRRQPQHAATPIVVVTTEEGPAVEQRVLMLGADDYILKPFEPTVLTSRIKSAFRRQRLGAWS